MKLMKLLFGGVEICVRGEELPNLILADLIRSNEMRGEDMGRS